MQPSHVFEFIVSAFMNAPQLDGRNARVPVDLSVKSRKARVRVYIKQNDGNYCATVPQLPMTTTRLNR
ncbi:hypothetical protein Plhal703r1_c12g0061541 [Plasmopara halstedii]